MWKGGEVDDERVFLATHHLAYISVSQPGVLIICFQNYKYCKYSQSFPSLINKMVHVRYNVTCH